MGQYTIKDVQNRAELLKDDIDNIYRALNDKLGSSPETLDQVPEYILSIPDLPTEEPLTITPTIDGQEISALDDLKYNPITVEPVTSAIDANIVPENIKEGVTILGVTGTLSAGSGGDTPDYRYMNGAVDKAGLKAIGWADEDILTYEQNIPPHYSWQNDRYKVSDENKALYLLDDPNPSSYKDNPNIEYVPNKNMKSYFAKSSGFIGMKYIKGIPQLDTSNMTNMENMFYECTSLTTIPQLDTSNVTNMSSMFYGCSSLTTIPQLDTSKVTNVYWMFYGCMALTTIPQLNTSKVTDMRQMFSGCANLTTVEGIDFSGLTSDLTYLFGWDSTKSKVTRFIVNGKINVSIKDNYSIKPLTAIDYDSVKSILAAADRTDNTNAKTLAFNRTMTDQNGELAALVASCTSKGWTISGLTLQ